MSENSSAKQDVVVVVIALRVLTAITGKTNPDPRDVEELRRMAPPCGDMPDDELACAIVRQALESRMGASARGPRAPTSPPNHPTDNAQGH